MNYFYNDHPPSTPNERLTCFFKAIQNPALAMFLSCFITFELNATSVPSTEMGEKDNSTVFSWSIPLTSESTGKNTSIDDMLAVIKSEPNIGIDSVLLVHKGKLVVEEYFDGWDADSLHTTRSASKAITSALVGIAIDKGYLSGINENVLKFFPEYDGDIDNWHELKRSINIHHLLSMTSGIKGNEDAMYPEDDWVKFFLDQPLMSSPGEKFSYATSGVVLLGSIIKNASRKRIPAFAEEYLFKPLSISQFRWPITNSRGNQGLAMTGGGLNLTPRDMAKFGLLYLNEGHWEGKQLISKEWIKKSTSAHATSDLYGEGFGYLWRIIERTVDEHTVHSIEAWGNGGQFILVFPGLDLVAVWTGKNFGKFPEMERPFKLMDAFVLPFFINLPLR